MRALRGETNFDFFLDFYHLDSKKCFHFAEKRVKRCEAQLMKAQGCDDKKEGKLMTRISSAERIIIWQLSQLLENVFLCYFHFCLIYTTNFTRQPHLCVSSI